MNNKKTSAKVASLAANLLQDKNSSAISKQLAASALAQAKTRKQTSEEMEGIASKVLKSDKYSVENKILAASLISQSNK